MKILALDPGPEKTGWVVYNGCRVLSAAIASNSQMLTYLPIWAVAMAPVLAIEMVSSFGMPVGKEIFETVWWAGRFTQAWPYPDEVRLIYRKDVKIELCGSARAKDSNVRQALLDRVGPRGTKKNPGATYGVSGDMWAALGVAVVAANSESLKP